MAIIPDRLKPHFISHDSLMVNSISNKKPLDLFIALDFVSSEKDSTCFSYLCTPSDKYPIRTENKAQPLTQPTSHASGRQSICKFKVASRKEFSFCKCIET